MNRNHLTCVILLSTTLAAGTCHAEFKTYEVMRSAEQAQSDNTAGQQTAERLTRRYHDTRPNCGADSQPAFLCTGIVLRATRALPPTEYAYAPNAAALKTGSSSFDFLRSDSNNVVMSNNYTSGFIFYPVLQAPADRTRVQVLCYFPLDGNSNARNQQGCGEYPQYGATSRSCTDQGINTGEQWFERFKADVNTDGKRCSFNVRDALNNLAGPNFHQGLRAKRLANASYPTVKTPGSLKLENWPLATTLDAQKIPLEAFFYLGGASELAALTQAKNSQQQYQRISGIRVPVIRVQLPANVNTNATFTFSPQDQN